ncbi:HBS1-like protein, partial [Ophiophagus hannah]
MPASKTGFGFIGKHFEDDDLYGQSVDDDYCISPSTAAQFIYSKRDNTSVSAEPLEEYDYEDSEHSNFISSHQLTRLEKAKLHSCLDHMKEVLGDTVPEKLLVEAVLSSNFDIQQALDSILAQDNKQNGKTKNEDNVIVGKPTKDLMDMELEHSALSQLANHLPVSSGMTELSGSLSSLTHSKSSPVKELESLSLSDLIAKSIAVDSPEIINSHSEFHLAKKVQPSVENSDIDLSVLIRKSVLSPEPEEIQLNTMLPETKALFSKQGQQMFLTKLGTKDSLITMFFEEENQAFMAFLKLNCVEVSVKFRGKVRDSQAIRTDSDIGPKVTKMTISGKKQATGFEVPCLVNANVEENGHNTFMPQKGFSAGDTIANMGIAEILPKSTFPSQTIQASEDSSVVPTSVKKSGKSKQQLDIKAELEKRQGGKHLLNLVVIGHVDAGKSTLMGHLLYLLGNVNKRTMHKYEQESKKAGKASFAYAWVLDETGEERERGVTMDVGMTKFETKTKIITLMDAPGHKDFIPNMITGAAQADVAVLVVDASRGEFEAGFETGGQTREHGLLVRSLGVTQLAVAVNKMDQVNWQQERFQEIVNKLGQFLKQAGFKESDVAYIPTSGLGGENLVTKSQTSELAKWYTGKCLLEQIDQGSGFCVTGKIEAGYVQVGERLLVMPPNETCTVKGIALHEQPVDWAAAGDHISLTLTGMDIIKIKCLTKGQNALIELQTQRPIALELYKDFKELGRFMLRYGGSTIAAGVVVEIKE